MFDVKKLSELDTYKKIWQRVKEKGGSSAAGAAFGSAVLFLTLNLLTAVIVMILEIAGLVEYVPGYIKVEWFCTALVFVGIEIMNHEENEREKQYKKAIKDVEINNQNWQLRFRQRMIQNIWLFRAMNQLTPREEAKFIRIVNYSVRERAKEIRGDRQREEKSVKNEAQESGASCVACHKLRYEWLGFEIDPEYFKKADERIKAEQSQLSIFDFMEVSR